jgi:ubiquinone/menaquinone biosynthesis C-methylase UbiE
MDLTMTTDLSERQKREKEYYESYAQTFNLEQEVDFSPIRDQISGVEFRPWNSYWRTYQIPIIAFKGNKNNQDQRLLDFGCGPGDNGLRLAAIGYNVSGFDISESNVDLANKLFSKNNMAHRGSFIVSTAEQLSFADGEFDMVVGIDILHHVDIKSSLKEVRRVLKEGGQAVFREPIEVPLLDRIRNSWPIRALVPNTASLESHITEDERKLNESDLKIIKEIFPNMRVERSLILSRFDKFIRKQENKKASWLEKIDYVLMKLIPGYKYLGGAAVIVVKK